MLIVSRAFMDVRALVFSMQGVHVWGMTVPRFLRWARNCILLGALLWNQSAIIRAGALRAGFARIDITPTQPVMLAGYESRKELSKGIHDPLSARAAALECDGEKLVLISIDNLGFYNDTAEPLRQSILDDCGLQPSQLMLCAIHTHSAPALGLSPERSHTNNIEYTKQLRTKLVEVTQFALRKLEPVQFAWASGASPVGVNRREVSTGKDGKPRIVLGRNAGLQTDREVQVLKAVRPDGGLAGVVFGYSTHSTSLGPGNYLVSGDIHGLAEQSLERYFGADVVTCGFAGASGNIDPWVRVLPDFRTNNGWIPEPVLMGAMLGQEVARVTDGTQCTIASGVIRSALRTIQLPGKKKTDDAEPVTAPIQVTVGCVGDIAFVGWGGEVFNEIGKEVKSGSPFRYTFVFTHCNGAAGYLPIQTAYDEGGYEVQSSRFGPGAAEQLAKETLTLLRELHSH